MHRRWQRAAAVFFLLPGFAASYSGLIQVTGIHFWSHSDSTRFIFDTTGPFEVRAERAFNPDRIFFDIQRALPLIDGHRYATQIVDDKLVSKVRVAETSPGTTRIVFDLKVPANFKMTRLDSPDRMVIDIEAMRPEPVNAETITRSAVPLPLPYVPLPADAPKMRVSQNGFVYPPGYGQVPHFRTPILWSNAPALAPVSAPAPPYLPEPVLRAKVVLPAAARSVPSDNASRSLTRALGLKVNRIVIDAGHGGHDDGTIGPNGVLEKDVVLDVALRLAKLVQAKMGAEVVLTRSDDTFIPLQQRTAIANEHKADLFLSIHANSSPAPGVAGTETFFLNFTNSPAALDVAARENAGSDKNVGELKDLIQSITLNDKIAESETFAQQVQNAIFAQASKSNAVAKNRGVKRAPFVVLIGASMPSVLAEIGFLSNARDEANLAKPEYRQKIAESLLKGLSQYAQSLSHFEVASKTAALN
jgi:N-acetylmuramoyl-L-alanine amidase